VQQHHQKEGRRDDDEALGRRYEIEEADDLRIRGLEPVELGPPDRLDAGLE